MGVSVSTYNSHERAGQRGARSLSVEDAKRYGRRFGVSPAWLLVGEGSVEPMEPAERDNDEVPFSSHLGLNPALLVGEFLSHWGILERSLDEAITALLKSPFVDLADIVNCLGADAKVVLLNSVGDAHSEKNPDLAGTVIATLKEIQNLAEIKNRIVNGRFYGIDDRKVKVTWPNAPHGPGSSEMVWSKSDFMDANRQMQQHVRTIRMFIEALTETSRLRDVG
ncbi:helix-turn-helix transcriptional regulator [Microvirga aerophila]|nr:helix-turn-helix transcriptional regulator [Microvirga aerophila]